MVLERPCSCDTVGCEMYRVILFRLLCPETDWKIRIGNQGYVFISTDFKKRCFYMLFLALIVSTINLRLRIV